MDNATYLARLASSVDRFTGLVKQSDLDSPVPSCPDWDVAALVDHVAVVHMWVGQILEHGRDGARFDDSVVPRPQRDPVAYASWYREAADALHADLSGRDPDTTCWNFSGTNQTVGFWPRRQMNEVNVHAFDAAVAAGTEFAIAPDDAADGIDELFTVMGPRMAQRGVTPDLTAPIAIAPTDIDASWTLHPPVDGGPATVTRGENEAVATLSGTASDLYLALWKRLPVERLTISGDADVAAAYLGSRLAP